MEIEEEISKYRSGDCPILYNGGIRKMVKPLIFHLLQNSDQPERREIFGKIWARELTTRAGVTPLTSTPFFNYFLIVLNARQ